MKCCPNHINRQNVSSACPQWMASLVSLPACKNTMLGMWPSVSDMDTQCTLLHMRCTSLNQVQCKPICVKWSTKTWREGMKLCWEVEAKTLLSQLSVFYMSLWSQCNGTHTVRTNGDNGALIALNMVVHMEGHVVVWTMKIESLREGLISAHLANEWIMSAFGKMTKMVRNSNIYKGWDNIFQISAMLSFQINVPMDGYFK